MGKKHPQRQYANSGAGNRQLGPGQVLKYDPLGQPMEFPGARSASPPPSQFLNNDADEIKPVVTSTEGSPIQMKPTSSQAGTVEQFIEVFNNTTSRMGQTTGQAAHDAMVRLGATELTLRGPLPTTTPYFNTRPARYIYTTSGGWIDMVHFLFHAGRAYRYLLDRRDAAETLEEIEAMPWYRRMLLPQDYILELHRRSSQSPVGESVQEGFMTERMQQAVTPRSAFSYEDIPSDTFGAQFAVDHFNPNLESTFADQLAAYMSNVLGATVPQNAPNFNELPAEDNGSVDRQNFNTTPVYTESNP